MTKKEVNCFRLYFIPIYGSSENLHTSNFPHGCCPRDYHKSMKSNRSFVRNPGNCYLWPRYSCRCDVSVRCKEGYL